MFAFLLNHGGLSYHGLLMSIFLHVFHTYSAHCLRSTEHSNSLKTPVPNVNVMLVARKY
jgi:hypothetical protein